MRRRRFRGNEGSACSFVFGGIAMLLRWMRARVHLPLVGHSLVWLLCLQVQRHRRTRPTQTRGKEPLKNKKKGSKISIHSSCFTRFTSL
jgi:hypothetical protein